MEEILKEGNTDTVINEEVLHALFPIENTESLNKKESVSDVESSLEALSIFSTMGSNDLAKEIDYLNSSLSKIYEKQLQITSKSVNTKEMVLVSLLFKSRKSLKNIIAQLCSAGEKMAEVFIELNNLSDKKSLLENELLQKEEEVKSAKTDLDDKQKTIDELTVKLKDANERSSRLALLEKELLQKEEEVKSAKTDLFSLKNELDERQKTIDELTVKSKDANEKSPRLFLLEKKLLQKEEEVKSAKTDLFSLKNELDDKQKTIDELTVKSKDANEKSSRLSLLEKELELKGKLINDLDKKCRGLNDYESKISLLEKEIDRKEKAISELKDIKVDILPEAQHRVAEPSYNNYNNNSNGIQQEFFQREIKELQQLIARKDLELLEARMKEHNNELLEKISKSKENNGSFKDYVNELKEELSKHYNELSKEKISSVQKQMESHSNEKEKEKEWEINYTKLNEQHKTELLILEDRHKKQMQNLQSKIQDMEKELGVIGNYKHSILNLFQNKNKNGND